MSEQAPREGLPEEEFSELMQSIGTMAPLLGGLLRPQGDKGGKDDGRSDHCARRETLLCALKPYLSEDRCAAVDYLIRLWRVGDAIKGLR